MARGAAQARRKRTKADARRRRRRAQSSTPAPIASQTMFFPRLRRSAKWVFFFLAVVFAAGFVVFGVGSGSGFGGLSELFRNGNTTKGAESQARDEIKKNPNDPKGWQDLAQALSANGDVQGEIAAYHHALRLQPKNTEVLSALAGVYQLRGSRLQTQITALQNTNAQLLSVFNSGITLKKQLVVPPDPIFSAVSSTQTTRLNDLFSKQQSAYGTSEHLYKKIAKLQPKDAPSQLSLGVAAQQAGDTATAIAAYKRFIALAPSDPSVPGIKQQIKALQQAGSTPQVGTTGG
jgi:tetratricopeptide (TPR) repeat protein